MKTIYLHRNDAFRRRMVIAFFLLLTMMVARAQDLYVGTYNIRNNNSGDTNAGNGWDTRKVYLFNMINFQQPDLLGVQEALKGQVADMVKGLKGYGYIGVGRDDGVEAGEYSAIFYRKARMALIDYGDFWLSDTPEKPSKGFVSKGGSGSFYRIVTWGKFLDKATGSLVYHFNTHMDLDEINRQQSYYLIKQKIEELAGSDAPVIVSGDFNAEQTSGAYKLFYNSGFLYDCHDVCQQRFMTNGTAVDESGNFNASIYTTVSTGELRRIDHLFVTDNFEVDHYGVLNSCYYATNGSASYYTRMYSDHNPVMAKLNIKVKKEADFDIVLPPLVDDIYQISSPDELVGFSCLVNGLNGYEQDPAAKAVLTQDIDMGTIDNWRPIGSNSAPFAGVFDGQGHTISNLTINTGTGLSGLFGKTSKATVKNFRITGTLTVADGTVDHGVIGYAENTMVSDIHSSLQITVATANTNTKHVGGIVGTQADGTTITRCSFAGVLSDAGSDTVGGIAGYSNQANNSITYCINYGTVSSGGSTTNTGGILGYVNHTGFKISNCANVGTVSGNATYAGQIFGRQLKTMTAAPALLYYLAGQTLTAFGSGTITASAKGATEKTESEYGSGEVAFLLNGSKGTADVAFRQNLRAGDDTDEYPVLYADHHVVSQGQFGWRLSRTDATDYNFYVNEEGTLDQLSLINYFATPVPFTAGHATYSRTVGEEWNTLYLPYRVESGQGMQLYQIVGLSTDGDEGILTVVPVDGLDAYTPGLFQTTATTLSTEANEAYIAVPPTETFYDTGVDGLVMTGTLATVKPVSGCYILSNGKFVPADGTTSIGAFGAYLANTGLDFSQLLIHVDDGTGLERLETTDGDTKDQLSVYDLQGRRIVRNDGRLKPGIYIVGGQKIVVR